MPGPLFLILLGGLLVLAFAAEAAYSRLRVPPVIVLMACGLVLGPVTHFLTPKSFLDVAPQFGALAFLLIIFEGGLDLELKTVIRRFAPGAKLAVAGFVLTLLAATGIAAAIGISWPGCLAIGIVVAPISGAIVLPLAGRLGFREELRTVVVLEAALADVLGVVSIGLFERSIDAEGISGLLAAGSLGAAAGSVAVAILAGLLWPRVLRALGEQRYLDALTFGLALLMWGAIESLGASGALAVLTFGLTLANESAFLRAIHIDPTPVAELAETMTVRLHEFIGQLTFVVRAFFFVFLGIVVEIRGIDPRLIVMALLLVVAMIVVRRAVLGGFQAIGTLALSRSEMRAVWMLQPRGLVSAVLAIEVAHLELAGTESLLGIVSIVILVTNLLLMAGLRGKLEGEPVEAAPAMVSSARAR